MLGIMHNVLYSAEHSAKINTEYSYSAQPQKLLFGLTLALFQTTVADENGRSDGGKLPIRQWNAVCECIVIKSYAALA